MSKRLKRASMRASSFPGGVLKSPPTMTGESLGSAPKDSPVIVGGDFNTPPGKELARMEALFSRFDMSRVSTSAAETWRLGPLEGVLDHIFARGMSVVRSGTVEDSHCSDHKPVWVEMLVEGGESS